MEFPEDFNQLELLNTHGHLIPRGASSLWSSSKNKDDDEEEEEEAGHSEEWYLEKEETLKDQPAELLLWAAEHNRLSTVHRLLTTHPLLVHCCDEDGYTPLHRAAYSGHVNVVSALIAAGSKVNPRTIDGWTPLHSACCWSRVAVVSVLLQHGADLNGQTNGGLTPLHLAASHNSSTKTDTAHTLELLLSQRHLRPGLHSSSKETAGEVARRSGPHHFLFEMVEDCVNVCSSEATEEVRRIQSGPAGLSVTDSERLRFTFTPLVLLQQLNAVVAVELDGSPVTVVADQQGALLQAALTVSFGGDSELGDISSQPLLRFAVGSGGGGGGAWVFLSFFGRPTRPLFLPFLTYSRVGVGFGAGAGAGTSGFSFTFSPSDSPSEYESAEFPDITGGRERGQKHNTAHSAHQAWVLANASTVLCHMVLPFKEVLQPLHGAASWLPGFLSFSQKKQLGEDCYLAPYPGLGQGTGVAVGVPGMAHSEGEDEGLDASTLTLDPNSREVRKHQALKGRQRGLQWGESWRGARRDRNRTLGSDTSPIF
ncbi:hypothetical protein INR49_025786, partial [Caranx melampygus]